MRGISWLAENLLASQEGLCSVELFIAYRKDVELSLRNLLSQDMMMSKVPVSSFGLIY